MQTAMHPAFAEKLAVLAALLERSKFVRAETHARIGQPAPRYQVANRGSNWNVEEIATGEVQGYAFTYPTALRFVDVMEAGAASKQASQ